MENTNKYMMIALKEAKKAYKNNEVPVGAVIVKNNVIISKGYNKKVKTNNVIKHAEIIAIEKACKKLNNWRSDDCEIYITLEPCLMCCGAIEQARISKIYYATDSKLFGQIENNNIVFKNNNKIEIHNNIYPELSKKILNNFFKLKRK